MALLAEKGISYETNIANPDDPRSTAGRSFVARAAAGLHSVVSLSWPGRLPCCGDSHHRQAGRILSADLRNERRVDRVLLRWPRAAWSRWRCSAWATTDWRVRRILRVAGRRRSSLSTQNARFEVFQYIDGSKRLWISDLRTPELIAPANESTLGELTRQGITCETYVANTGRNLPATGTESTSRCAVDPRASGGRGWPFVVGGETSASFPHHASKTQERYETMFDQLWSRGH